MIYLSFANFSHMPTWDKRGVIGQQAPLKKVYNAGMLKHTFRSSKILEEATKNVIHLMYLLKWNISSHRSHNSYSATIRGLSHKVWSQTIQAFHHQFYIYTGNFKEELQLNYLLQNIQLQQGSHYLFKMRYIPA